jgi:hypothetical protein
MNPAMLSCATRSPAGNRRTRSYGSGATTIDEVAAELGRSLDHFKVPEPEKGEVLAAFAVHKDEVNEGYSK